MDQSRFTILEYTDKERYIHMPNEIFDDLQSVLPTTQAAFAYCYYFLITYLYRYAKYSSHKFTQPELKQMLRYSPTNSTIDYITKKNGVLDKLGYTEAIKDYPVSWLLEDKELRFTLLSDLKSSGIYKENEKNYKIKVPIKAFYRTSEARDIGYQNGTFYEVDNTHGISIATFINAMENPEISTIGFYIYGYLKERNDKFRTGVFVSTRQFKEKFNLSSATTTKYIKALRKYGYLDVVKGNYYSGVSNKYITKEQNKIPENVIS